MIGFWVFALIGAGVGGQGLAQPASPAIKTCANGAVVRATDTCPTLPDHRYLLVAQPARRTEVQRWWCGKERRPSEVGIAFSQPSATDPHAPEGTVARLESLTVYGVIASPALRRTVADAMAGAGGLWSFSVGCLAVRGQRPTPILTLHGAGYGRQGAKEIPLR